MKKRNKVRVLSIDGGGIRGIIPATILVYMESEIQRITEKPEARLGEYLDMVVGTSTGAILAALLLVTGTNGKPKYTAQEALDFYAKHGEEIFNKSKIRGLIGQLSKASKFSEKNLERLFAEKLGDKTLDQLLKPCLITSYNMGAGSAVFFNSRETKPGMKDFLLRDVLRSTSAAPTYFDPKFISVNGKKMVNLDGGVFANNPAMCAYAECRGTKFDNWEDATNPNKPFPTAKNMLMLSLGTGGGYIDLDKAHKAKGWGLLTWAKKTPDIMMDGGLDTVNYQVKKLFESLENEEDRMNFKRVDFPKQVSGGPPPYSADMSDARSQNIQRLKTAGGMALEDARMAKPGEHTLDKFIELLIDES